jgi:acetylornithine deacetylase/succinyl-diaminopimelate desuccinylase-like protein
MSREDVRAQVEQRLAEAHAASPSRDSVQYKVIWKGFQSEGCVLDAAQPLVTELTRCHQDVTGQGLELTVSTGTTDARTFNLYGPITDRRARPSMASTSGCRSTARCRSPRCWRALSRAGAG